LHRSDGLLGKQPTAFEAIEHLKLIALSADTLVDGLGGLRRRRWS
jgi:hypothetical protein